MALSLKQTRKIKANYRSVTGHILFRNEKIPYESTLERDFLLYFSSLKEVVGIIPQPVQINFTKHGRNYIYTPDFLVQFSSQAGDQKHLLVEVKPESEWKTHWRDWSEKWKAAQIFAKKEGFAFHIYDETRIRHQALKNLTFLNNFKQIQLDPTLLSHLLREINNREMTTVETLLECYFKAGEYRKQGHRALFHLMACGLIDFDIWADDIQSEKLTLWASDYERYRLRAF